MKKWLWIILIASLILTSPMIYQRATAEWNYDTYEITVPFDEMDKLIREGAEERRVLNGLRKAGVTSVSFMPETIDSLEDKGQILVFDQNDIVPIALGAGLKLEDLPDKEGLYISDIETDIPLKESLKTVFEDRWKELEMNGRDYIFVEGNPKVIEDLFLSYSQKQIDRIEEYGYSTVLRIPVDEIIETNEFIWDQAFTLNGSIDKVLFYGAEALGYPEKDFEKWGERLKENEYSLLTIEQYGQKGIESLAAQNDLNVIRLRSFDIEQKRPSELEEEAVRAVKERNIRVLYFHLLTLGDAKRLIEENIAFFQGLEEAMPAKYQNDEAFTFPSLAHDFWEKIVILVGSVAFLMLAVSQFLSRKWVLAAGAGGALVALLYLVTSHELLLKLLALGVAPVTPVVAALSYKEIKDKRSIVLQYLKAVGISFIGIWLVVGLLFGTEFFLHVGEGFRGVKVLYLFPIAFTILYVLFEVYRRTTKRFSLNQAVTLLDKPIKYWHLIIIGAFGVVMLYYVSRTGNAGSVSEFELMARQMLEDLLFVRPRTKELLIGFPFYVLGLYLFMRNYVKLGLLCMIPSIIGWLSLVNTFTHLHIPLYLSLLRSLYSLSFGFVIGLLFIVIFKIGNRYVSKWKARW
ncbi:DUF5693 family protein [Pseudalkalibacillus sp. SCS-8]|uniref:DUF5693 family protein n=1 Tax=Pseudalkalibacillus nanhaiensis TaxID=3115291 RepID=UPI0032DA3976